MMLKPIALSSVLLSVAAVSSGSSLEELDRIVSENSVGYGTDNSAYVGTYVDGMTDAARERLIAANLAAQRERIRLAPDKAAYRLSYGSVLLFFGNYADALEQYEAALPLEKQLKAYDRGQLRFERAECLYALGRKTECLAALDELLALKLGTVRRNHKNWNLLAGRARSFLAGMDLDERRLPRFTDAKPYPRPQQATYEERFAPLKTVRLALSGVRETDARVRLLKTKLARMGVRTESAAGEYVLSVACDAQAPVDRPEGYALTIGPEGAEIRARDLQGVLWGVVSFLQCVDPAKVAVRHCRIRDWPDAPRRGYLCKASEFHLEFALFNKLNSVDFQDDAWCSWNRFSPLEVMMAKTQARQFADFGLDFYYGIAWATMYPRLPLSAARTFEKHLEICRFYAACGAGVYFPFDDGRFPLPDADKQAFGIAANIDAKYVTRLYRTVKAEFPDFKLIFCPPFYWGPDSPASYPEEREPYLKSLGEFLDPAIDCYWTGPMVKGYDKSPAQLKWYADLTGRKPSVFQNGCGAHNLVSYGVDPTPWNVWHDGDFVKGIGAFHQNTNFAEDGPQIATLADWLWNGRDYEATDSIRRAVGQLVGAGVYETLAAALPSLASFDKYRYGELTVDVLSEKLPDLEARLAVATNAWQKAIAQSDATARSLGGFGRGCGFATDAVRKARTPPDFLARYAKAIRATQELATQEVGYDKARGDILFTAVDTTGATILDHTDKALPKTKQHRLGKCLRGASTSRCEISGKFECDPFPPSGAYELLLVANEDERADENEIEVTVNGKSVWRGKTGLPHDDYGILRIPIPFDSMIRNNVFSIRNLTPGTNPNGTPWLVVNYMVLRKAEEAK